MPSAPPTMTATTTTMITTTSKWTSSPLPHRHPLWSHLPSHTSAQVIIDRNNNLPADRSPISRDSFTFLSVLPPCSIEWFLCQPQTLLHPISPPFTDTVTLTESARLQLVHIDHSEEQTFTAHLNVYVQCFYHPTWLLGIFANFFCSLWVSNSISLTPIRLLFRLFVRTIETNRLIALLPIFQFPFSNELMRDCYMQYYFSIETANKVIKI